ncbi:hypothetical protein L1887_24076 [Cichorium endivia]|nr:hypothetical protein L1887_24076 [Cichorium endivia]
MVGWRIRAEMAELEIGKLYASHPTVFSIKLFYGGEFTHFPGRRYINGKEKFVDLVDIDEFCVHDIDDMMDTLGYVEEGKLLYFHFKRPFSDLDFGLFALASDSDITHLRTYVGNHKLIEVYTEHGKTNLHTYLMSPNPSKVRIEEIIEMKSCARRLFLEWKDPKTGDGGGSSKVRIEEVVESPKTGGGGGSSKVRIEEVVESPKVGDGGVPILSEEMLHGCDQTASIEHEFEGEGIEGQNEDNHSEGEGIEGQNDDLSDSEDSDFIIDEDNIVDDPDIDMKEFLLNIDEDVEWLGTHETSQVIREESREKDELEVVNNEILLSESSDEGGSNKRKKSIKAIRRAQENSEARVSDPFYVYQTFGSAEELKRKIKKHSVETRREIEIVKNDKNRVRAVCKGTIPDLGQIETSGPSQTTSLNNDGTPEKKCPWVLYASKWKQDVDWEVKTYVQEHKCLQSRDVKACTYKFLSQQIVQQIDSNPNIPTRALQEQLQREYQVDLSRMKVFRAKSEAHNQVRGDYAGQYAILRDYVLELKTRNPDSTVKIEVENEPNPDSATRTFKRIYICLGSLKKGFQAGKRDYLGLDGSFMKGSYPGMILTAVGLDGNSCTYPLAYVVVEAENINSWTWFLSCLGDDIDLHTNSNFTFVSDRQKGLLQAIGTLFPCAEHRFCLRHIHENMKLQWKGKAFKDMLWKCATTTTVQEFNHAMEEFRQLNNECYKWLKAIPAQHWSRSHFTGRAHCDGLLNNLCETINNQLRDARDQPIITCLEFIREYLMLRIVTVQKAIDKAPGPLTPTATITGPWMDQCVVDMIHHTCSCRKWELTGIPCKHSIVAIWDMRKNKQDTGLPETWVHPTYWLKTWKDMYSFKIEPINGRRMWQKYACPTTLLPPKHHVPIGRPKKKRTKSALELEDMTKGSRASRKEKSVTCSACKKVGHNKRSCKGQGASSGAGDGKRGSKRKGVMAGKNLKKG